MQIFFYKLRNIFFWTPTPNADQYLTMALAVGKQVKTVTPQEVSKIIIIITYVKIYIHNRKKKKEKQFFIKKT